MTRYSIVGQKHLGLDSHLVGILPGTPVVLVREPTNAYDPNAVQVWIDGKRVGYIPKADAAKLAPVIDKIGRDFGTDVLAQDGLAVIKQKAIDAVFARSPNSAYPQCDVADL
jgi:HIRAN domain